MKGHHRTKKETVQDGVVGICELYLTREDSTYASKCDGGIARACSKPHGDASLPSGLSEILTTATALGGDFIMLGINSQSLGVICSFLGRSSPQSRQSTANRGPFHLDGSDPRLYNLLFLHGNEFSPKVMVSLRIQKVLSWDPAYS